MPARQPVAGTDAPQVALGERLAGGDVLADVQAAAELERALFGFGGIAAGAAGIAKILFFVFVIMAVAAFVMGLVRKT